MATLTIVIGNKNYSSWSLRGWLAAMHTGLPVSEIGLQLDTASFYTEIEKYSPARKVPTLLHDGIRVWDSAAIIDYCARLAPKAYWWPDEMRAYAMARSVAAEMHSGFAALRENVPMNLRKSWSGNFGKSVLGDITRIDDIWSECRTRFGTDGDFLFGQFSAADMMYAPVVARFMSYNAPVSDVSQNYMQAMRSYPLIEQWYKESATERAIVEFDEIAEDAKRLG